MQAWNDALQPVHEKLTQVSWRRMGDSVYCQWRVLIEHAISGTKPHSRSIEPMQYVRLNSKICFLSMKPTKPYSKQNRARVVQKFLTERHAKFSPKYFLTAVTLLSLCIRRVNWCLTLHAHIAQRLKCCTTALSSQQEQYNAGNHEFYDSIKA